jgi:acetylornithine/N-succinyldiaminopimelate aminotransferase
LTLAARKTILRGFPKGMTGLIATLRWKQDVSPIVVLFFDPVSYWRRPLNSKVMPTYGRIEISFEKGEGSYLIDDQGNRFLDFCTGIATASLGHAHPHLVEALTEQAAKVWHTSNLFRIPGQERLAERLVENSFADQVFFCNSGAEASEGCIKTARKYQSATGHPERYRIITIEGAFHGRTLATLAAGGKPEHLDGFGPVVEGFDHVPAGDIEAMKAAVGPETAAIMVEAVQGEGGVNTMAPNYLKSIRKLCDDEGILLLMDEVQTGMGRTGTLFAYEWEGVTPDVMGLAKALGNGMPIGAVLATEKAAVGMTPGTHGSTYGGNPLAVAAANAVLDVMLEDGFFDHVKRMSGLVNQKLAGLVDAHPDILESVRGQGLLIGLKCKASNLELVDALRAEGVLTVGAADNIVRLIPPLIVSEEEVGEAMDALDRACTALEKTSIQGA